MVDFPTLPTACKIPRHARCICCDARGWQEDLEGLKRLCPVCVGFGYYLGPDAPKDYRGCSPYDFLNPPARPVTLYMGVDADG